MQCFHWIEAITGFYDPSRLDIPSLLYLYHCREASKPGITSDQPSTRHIRALNLTNDICSTSAYLGVVCYARPMAIVRLVLYGGIMLYQALVDEDTGTHLDAVFKHGPQGYRFSWLPCQLWKTADHHLLWMPPGHALIKDQQQILQQVIALDVESIKTGKEDFPDQVLRSCVSMLIIVPSEMITRLECLEHVLARVLSKIRMPFFQRFSSPFSISDGPVIRMD
jgi:hypothetical protein